MHIHYSSCTSTSTSDELCHEPYFYANLVIIFFCTKHYQPAPAKETVEIPVSHLFLTQKIRL